jgi:ubiquinone biosynthesis protein COQ4
MTPTVKPADRAAAPSDDMAKLSPLVRWSRAIRSLAHVLANPEATDKVIEFLQLANTGALRDRAAAFFADPRGARLYAEQRKIDSRTVDVDQLLSLPAGTLGHAYATFLRSHGLTPDVFDDAPDGVPDPKLAYVIQRTRQTHDLWHVVTGCKTDPAGEIALQAFTYAQVHAPGNAILAIAGALKGMREKPGILRDVVALFRTGARANPLPVFPWEDHWTTPLTEVRALLGLPAQPLRRHAA